MFNLTLKIRDSFTLFNCGVINVLIFIDSDNVLDTCAKER